MSSTWDHDRLAKVQRLVKDLYRAVDELQEEFAGDNRRFTLDGHLVGSIGEIVAAYVFDLKLLPSSHSIHDAEGPNGELVQVKLTGGRSVALYSEPRHLIVLRWSETKVKSVYNGPGHVVWSCCGKQQKNGQRCIGVTKLMDLDRTASPKIKQIREFPL